MSEVAKQLAKFIRELHDRPPHLLCTVKAILSNASKIWPTAWKNFTEAVAADALKKKVGAISIVAKPEATVDDVKPEPQPVEDPKVVRAREELGIRKELETIAKNIYNENVLTVVGESKTHESIYNQLASTAKINLAEKGRFLGLFLPRSHSECSPYQNRNPYAIDAPIDQELTVFLNLMVRMIRPKARFMDSGSRETMYVLWKGSRPRGCEKLWQHVGRQAPLTSDILTNIPVMHPDELPRCSVIEKAAARGATIIHNNAIPASEESAGDGESEESESPKKSREATPEKTESSEDSD